MVDKVEAKQKIAVNKYLCYNKYSKILKQFY